MTKTTLPFSQDQVEELQERLRERGNPALHREPVVGESLATELAQMEVIDTESNLVQETRADKLAAQNKALQEQLVGGGLVLMWPRRVTHLLPSCLLPWQLLNLPLILLVLQSPGRTGRAVGTVGRTLGHA